jgi:hypothetical protein
MARKRLDLVRTGLRPLPVSSKFVWMKIDAGVRYTGEGIKSQNLGQISGKTYLMMLAARLPLLETPLPTFFRI